MKGFRLFFEQTQEQDANIKDTLKKLPKSHRRLISQYKIKWHCDNTLNGDDEHIGLLNPNNKTINIAGGWRFPRQWVFLHETGHKVFERFVLPNEKLLAAWKNLVKNTKDKPKQSDEELFCNTYSCYYSDNKIEKFNLSKLINFIKNLPK